MTDPRKQLFSPYVRQIADLMGLKDWIVHVGDGPPTASNANASTFLRYGAKDALIKLSEDFLNDPPAHQRITIVHELIHLHLAPADGLITDFLGDETDPRYKAYWRMMEYAIDGLAVAWAETLPLPDDDDEDEGPVVP
jgi:hypothetical protein